MCSISEIAFCTLTYQLVSGLFLWFISLYQMTPLHLAAERGRYRVVEYLIDLRAEISAEDNDGVSIYSIITDNFKLATFSSFHELFLHSPSAPYYILAIYPHN